jgi:hypothetical protein
MFYRLSNKLTMLSKQFGTWDQNLLTEWHVRYGRPGIRVYWLYLFTTQDRVVFGVVFGRGGDGRGTLTPWDGDDS